MSAHRLSTRHSARLLAAAMVAALAAPVAAAPTGSWQVVLAANAGSVGERIEIDRSRVIRDGDTAFAWSRVSLGRPVADAAGVYNAIEALNRYDCESRRFTTLHRVYFNDDTALRGEHAVRSRANAVVPGSIDERLFNEACKPRPRDLARQEEVAQSHAAAFAADGYPEPTNFMRVADAGSATAAPAAEKPRMIELPKIDKEAAAREAAAAGMTVTPAAKPAAPTPAAAATSPPVKAAGTPARLADPRPLAAAAGEAHAAAAKPAAKPVSAATKAVPEFPVSGHARELMLATSGPRKAPAKAKEHNPAKDMHAHWGYDGAGAPANWGKLKPEFATCETGKRQSPIDIRPGIAVDLESIKFNYKPTQFRVFDNGHTIQVNVGAGSTIEVMGKRYELVQFHFHKPSEERVEGRAFPMVAHFVHKDLEDNLAVIAVLLDEGAENPVIQAVWNNIPLEKESEVLASGVLEPARLLPENRAYWTYMGSLTTPPCSEGVLWMVMKQPVPISAEQVAIFGRLYKNNARPIQPANNRLIKQSR